MKVIIEIHDDTGKVLVHHEANAMIPTQWRVRDNDKPLVEVEQLETCDVRWSLFGITCQPQVHRQLVRKAEKP